MQQTIPITRQQFGCPLTAANPTIVATPWRPAAGYSGPVPTACPGYTTQLPEVIEAARAWSYWQKGELSHLTGGKPASEELLDRLDQIDHAVSEHEHSAREAAKAGA